MRIHKFKLFFQLICFIIALISCSKQYSRNSIQLVATPDLVIDSAGIVPIFGENSSSSIIYVHNNGSKVISGIQYTAIDSNAVITKNMTTHGTLNPASTEMCQSINPGQSCPISFTTASPNSDDFAGSIILSLSYTSNNQPQKVSQLINYKKIDNQIAKGVVINSGVKIVANKNAPAYGVVYAYGSGQGKIYRVTSQTLDKSAFSITQGSLVDQDVASNTIAAIEIKAPLMFNETIDAIVNLTIISQESVAGDAPPNKYSSTINNELKMPSTNNGAILIVGNSPLINVSNNKNGVINLYNAGKNPTNLGIISVESVIKIKKNTCLESILPNQACSISFEVESSTTLWSATMTIPYSNGVESQVTSLISWYKIGGPLLSIVASPSPIIFNALESQIVTVSVKNVGAVLISNLSVPNPTFFGDVSASVNSTGNSCADAKLEIGEACSYEVTMSTSSESVLFTAGSVNFGIIGNYLESESLSMKSYNRQLNSTYTVAPFVPIIAVTVPDFTILGDGTETDIESVIIHNIGEAPATLESELIINTTKYNTTLSGKTCPTLRSGESCTSRTITYGPVKNTTGKLIQVRGDKNTFAYSIDYSFGTTPKRTNKYNVALNADVTVNTKLTIESFTASDSSSGNGADVYPFIFSGANPTNQAVTITYKNSGSTAIKITGINNTNSGFEWEIDTGDSTCYNGSILDKTLDVGESCTVRFKNVLFSNFIGLGNIGSTYEMNLSLPDVIYVTNPGGVQYQQKAKLSTIHVRSTQAVMINEVESSTDANTVVVKHTLTNAASYNSITVTASMENYFNGVPVESGCTQQIESSVRSQTCSFDSDGTLSVTYNVESLYRNATLNVNFGLISTSPTNGVVSFSPLIATLTLK